MLLKHAALALALVAVSGCKKPKPAAPVVPAPALPIVSPADTADDPRVWKVRSSNQLAVLTQGLGAAGQCELQCELEGKPAPVWKAVVDCFGQRVDWRFVANDCERTVVLLPSPSRGQAWRKTMVMRVYKRHMLDYPVYGPGVVTDETKLLNQGSWLKGCFGVAGEPPHYSDDGQAVEFTTVAGSPQRVPLVRKE